MPDQSITPLPEKGICKTVKNNMVSCRLPFLGVHAATKEGVSPIVVSLSADENAPGKIVALRDKNLLDALQTAKAVPGDVLNVNFIKSSDGRNSNLEFQSLQSVEHNPSPEKRNSALRNLISNLKNESNDAPWSGIVKGSLVSGALLLGAAGASLFFGAPAAAIAGVAYLAIGAFGTAAIVASARQLFFVNKLDYRDSKSAENINGLK